MLPAWATWSISSRSRVPGRPWCGGWRPGDDRTPGCRSGSTPRTPWHRFSQRFVLGDPDVIYLDGNSLGRPPLAARERLAKLLDQWGSELVRYWKD